MTDKITEGAMSSWLDEPVTKMVITQVQDQVDDAIATVTDSVEANDMHKATVALGRSHALEDLLGFIKGLVDYTEEGDYEG